MLTVVHIVMDTADQPNPRALRTPAQAISTAPHARNMALR
ncbi:hypothetical protein BSIN_0930 [Burkholderia singularis]|uniref:Uncharacterized protein n=1 Tax=Burkholderia singularis TaxID=1503053 RepID=A0A238HAU8_9BURK|nr:hypothetical protein BSIN_0930 [Burkholderia singularis]